MFQPNYRLSPKILTNIAFIERLYGQLETLRIPKQLELNLERNNIIQSTYISNSIEGNSLSLPEVTNLLLADRIPLNREEKEIKNYFVILKKLADYTNQSLSLELTKEFHHQLLSGVNDEIAGKLRAKRVVVGRYEKKEGKKKLEIKNALMELFSFAEENKETPIIIKTGIFHHQFVYIHPFEDGNGRVCRLLTAFIFLRHGYLVNKYFLLDDYYDIDRLQYSDKLHSADTGDKTEWLEYFSDGVKYSLQAALFRVKNSLSTLRIFQQPTRKEKEVLKILEERKEISSSQLASQLKISRQQAHNLLKSLMEKGFLDKRGQTKASYYFIK